MQTIKNNWKNYRTHESKGVHTRMHRWQYTWNCMSLRFGMFMESLHNKSVSKLFFPHWIDQCGKNSWKQKRTIRLEGVNIENRCRCKPKRPSAATMNGMYICTYAHTHIYIHIYIYTQALMPAFAKSSSDDTRTSNERSRTFDEG